MKESRIIIIISIIIMVALIPMLYFLQLFGINQELSINIITNLECGVIVGLVTAICQYFMAKRRIINAVYGLYFELYTTYYTSNNNLIVKTLDEFNHYAYYRMPRQTNYGEKISVTIKSNSMREQLPVDWNIITCNGFGEKYIDDTCGIQRQRLNASLFMEVYLKRRTFTVICRQLLKTFRLQKNLFLNLSLIRRIPPSDILTSEIFRQRESMI